MLRYLLSFGLVLTFVLAVPGAEPEKQPAKEATKPLELTLEMLFPSEGLFGHTATGMSFSHDGKYAAYLYRPYKDRYDGSDLYLFESATGKATKITSYTKMAKYQATARKVKESRTPGTKGPTVDENNRPFIYYGIRSFMWSPVANELLFVSEGDIYRWKVGEEGIARLTMTRSEEKSIAYLPDGNGYTCQRDGAVMRVVFGSSEVEQIDPKLPGGEALDSFSISPDGKRMVVVSRKWGGTPVTDRKVGVASYRDRFMKINEVQRPLSEDPVAPIEMTVYLHDVNDPMVEDGPLNKIFSYTYTGVRDVLSKPDWSPDSKRVAFAVFQQSSSQTHIMMAEIGGDPKPGAKKEPAKPAKTVHKFLHTGGPNTPRMMTPEFLDDNRRLVLLTETSGFRHLHVLDPLYETLDQMTSGRYEVYPIGLTKDRKSIFVAATRESPGCQDVYKVDLSNNKMERLTSMQGCYENAAISPDGQHLLANFVRYGSCKELVYANLSKPAQVELTDSHPLKTRQIVTERPEFFTYKNRHGHDIHGSMIKPPNMSKADKRPLLIYVYGGPLGTAKQVREGNYAPHGYLFPRYMAEKHGYICVTIDPRGMSGYGGAFEKSNFQQVGKPQVEDLVDGVKYLIANYGVDAKKVGIYGWSFGGFQTQMCMYTEPDVFAVGIAGAGPTEWENYHAWYSTGTIDTSKQGTPDLSKYSLAPLAKNLKGQLLLVHGMEDTNVLFQDTIKVYRELLKAGKSTQVELFLDPTGNHHLGGDVTSLTEFRKYEDFLLKQLGKGTAAPVMPMTTTSQK